MYMNAVVFIRLFIEEKYSKAVVLLLLQIALVSTSYGHLLMFFLSLLTTGF